MGHVSGPAMVQRFAYRLQRTSTRSESLEPDLHAPSVPLHDPLHLLPVHHQVHLPLKHHHDSAIPVPWISLYQFMNRMLNVLVYRWSASPSRLVLHRGPGNPDPLRNLPQACPLPLSLQHRLHSPDEFSSSESISLAFFKTSIWSTSSPIFSRCALICSSYSVCTRLGLFFRPWHPNSRKVFIHPSITLYIRSFALAASTTVLCPLMISRTRSAFRFKVHRSIAGWLTTLLLFIIMPPYRDFTAYHSYSPSGGYYTSLKRRVRYQSHKVLRQNARNVPAWDLQPVGAS